MKSIAPLAAVFTLFGCMVNPMYLSEKYSSTRLTDGRLSIALAPEKYNELGGKHSPALDSFIEAVVAEKKACVDGFTAAEPMPVRGYVSIVITCKPK
jgi:hypothetical protein